MYIAVHYGMNMICFAYDTHSAGTASSVGRSIGSRWDSVGSCGTGEGQTLAADAPCIKVGVPVNV